MNRSAVRTVTAMAIAFVVIPATAVSAAPGDLDPTFSTDGIVEVDFGAVAQDFRNGEPDGSKIVAVGEADDDFAIAQLRAGGGYGGGFAGGDGRRTIDFGYEDVAYGVAVHPDGRISIVGSADDSQGRCPSRDRDVEAGRRVRPLVQPRRSQSRPARPTAFRSSATTRSCSLTASSSYRARPTTAALAGSPLLRSRRTGSSIARSAATERSS